MDPVLSLRLRHRPSNGLLLFTATTMALGLAMMCRPEWVRSHDAFDYLDYVNLNLAGGIVVAAALCQLAADAMLWHLWRAAASCVVVAVYTGLALGTWSAAPAIAGVMYSSAAATNLLLAIRRI